MRSGVYQRLRSMNGSREIGWAFDMASEVSQRQGAALASVHASKILFTIAVHASFVLTVELLRGSYRTGIRACLLTVLA